MSKKISVDLTDENAGALYQNKKVHGLGYGPTIKKKTQSADTL